MEDYKFQSIIGDGTYGIVYKALHIRTNQVVAIKMLKTNESKSTMKEVRILKKLRHPNIVNLQKIWNTNGVIYMVFEYLEKNLLDHYMDYKRSGRPIPDQEMKSIMSQIIEGVSYIHGQGFFHRDLKPENILISDGIVKICDFGLVKEIQSNFPLTEYVATRWYRAPEIILKQANYNQAIDIFALGCIMAELITFRPLFPGNNELDQIQKIFKTLGSPHFQWQEGVILAQQAGIQVVENNTIPLLQSLGVPMMVEAFELIESMLQLNPQKRLSARQLLQQSYFQIPSNLMKTIDSVVTPEFACVIQPTEINNHLDDSPVIMEALIKKKNDHMRKTNFSFKLKRLPVDDVSKIPSWFSVRTEVDVNNSNQDKKVNNNMVRKKINETVHLPLVLKSPRQKIDLNYLSDNHKQRSHLRKNTLNLPSLLEYNIMNERGKTDVRKNRQLVVQSQQLNSKQEKNALFQVRKRNPYFKDIQ